MVVTWWIEAFLSSDIAYSVTENLSHGVVSVHVYSYMCFSLTLVR